MDKELGHDMEIGARVYVMGNAGADERQDGGGPLAALVEPGKEPVSSPMNSSP
jgi:hypothetical protein